MNDYLIWSNEHRAWWGPDEMGYTPDIMKAGRYSRRRAIDISRRATAGWLLHDPPPEIPVAEEAAMLALMNALRGGT